MKKKIMLLGASGSIGQQTLAVIRKYPEQFELVGIAVNTSIDVALEIIIEFDIKYLCIFDEEAAKSLQTDLQNEKRMLDIKTGMDGLIHLVTLPDVDVVMHALVGSVGILPTIEALKANKHVALANKETLVAAGSIVMEYAKASKGSLFPVDSEHSAIFQCLEPNYQKEMRRMIVTASGGALRDYSVEEMKTVTKAQVLNHPNWAMGQKITVDTATMMNKGFEVIEAKHLFNVEYDRIHVMIQRESQIHSMVEYVDGTILAHFGVSDMRIPIQYSLTYPERKPVDTQTEFDWSKAFALNFEPVNEDKYPAFKLIVDAGRKGGTLPAVLNAANEMAVYAFLNEKISFNQIYDVLSYCAENMSWIEKPTLEEILEKDQKARTLANVFIEKLQK